MATFTLDSLAVLVKDRCDGSAAFTAAVPGGAYYDRGPDAPTAYPYAVFRFEAAGDPRLLTDGARWQAYSLRMVGYVPPAAATTTPAAVGQAMDDAITKDPTAWADLPVGKVLHCLPRGWDGKFDPTVRAGQDIFVVTRQWSLAIQEAP